MRANMIQLENKIMSITFPIVLLDILVHQVIVNEFFGNLVLAHNVNSLVECHFTKGGLHTLHPYFHTNIIIL